MAQRPRPGKCVHCLNDPVERGWDRVFPASWYPDTTPPNLYKWRVPSCISCNRKLAAIEEVFRQRVVLGLDPSHPASRSVRLPIFRSMTPAEATDPRERQIRASRRQEILDDALTGDAIPQGSAYPGNGREMGQAAGPARRNPDTRGNPAAGYGKDCSEAIVYLEDDKFIEPPYRVEFLPPFRVEPLLQLLEEFGTTSAREPGIVVRRAVTPEDGVSSLFEIKLWQQFSMYVSVIK